MRWQDLEVTPDELGRFRTLARGHELGPSLWAIVSWITRESGADDVRTPAEMARKCGIARPVAETIARELLARAECGEGRYDFGMVVLLHLEAQRQGRQPHGHNAAYRLSRCGRAGDVPRRSVA